MIVYLFHFLGIVCNTILSGITFEIKGRLTYAKVLSKIWGIADRDFTGIGNNANNAKPIRLTLELPLLRGSHSISGVHFLTQQFKSSAILSFARKLHETIFSILLPAGIKPVFFYP